MRSFKVHTGSIVPLMEDNINTDQILPSRYLSRIEKTGFGEFLFANWRYIQREGQEESRELNPNFPLNDTERQGASILVTGNNFAGGSSREHAVWALDDYGIRCVIAGSFSDIFYMNSLKNGLLAITLSEEERQELSELSGDQKITVDLVEQEIRLENKIFKFHVDEEWRQKLLNGIDDITETLQYQEEIAAYEKKWNEFYK